MGRPGPRGFELGVRVVGGWRWKGSKERERERGGPRWFEYGGEVVRLAREYEVYGSAKPLLFNGGVIEGMGVMYWFRTRA
jgi:hypothetical protein